MALLTCSFCGRSEAQVAKLAAGAAGGHICDACVEACRVIMTGNDPGPARDFNPKTWNNDRLIGLLPSVNAAVETHRTHLQTVVDELRSRDVSWAAIGSALGVSRQSAWERFG